MKIAFSTPEGALAAALIRRLEREGHLLQLLQWGPGSGRGQKNGFANGRGARVREKLRGARALLHLSAPGAEEESLPLQVGRCLLPLAYLLVAAGEAARRIERVVVISPASLYGEGSYFCPVNGTVMPHWRREEDLRAHRWEHRCPVCQEQLQPAATPENHPAAPLSRAGALVYAQERLITTWARERRIPVVALRYFEVYGGPTGGDVAHLVTRAVEGLPLELREDGGQTRDYIHLEDVVRAVPLALRAPCRDALVMNIGTGIQTSALELVACLERALRRPLRVRSSGSFNRGEPRHLYAAADELARLGFQPALGLQQGLRQYVETLREVEPQTSQGRKS